MRREFAMPDVGEGLTEAEILTWHVAPGDPVAVNQILVEIETAKAAVELPSPYAGTVGALLAQPGETVAVGAPIIAIETAEVAPGSAPGSAPVSAPAASAWTEPGTSEPGRSAGAAAPAAEEHGAKIGEAGADGRIATLVGYGPRPGSVTRRPRRRPGGHGAGSGGDAAGTSDDRHDGPISRAEPGSGALIGDHGPAPVDNGRGGDTARGPGTRGTRGTRDTPGTPGTPGTRGTPGTPGTRGTPGTPGIPGTPGTPPADDRQFGPEGRSEPGSGARAADQGPSSAAPGWPASAAPGDRQFGTADRATAGSGSPIADHGAAPDTGDTRDTGATGDTRDTGDTGDTRDTRDGPAIESSGSSGKLVPLAKPPVRKLARDLGVDLRTVPGTGAGGVITREDVEAAADVPPPQAADSAPPQAADALPPPVADSPPPPLAAPSPPPTSDPSLAAGVRREPIRGVRRATAAAMVASAFTAPHVTEFLTVDVTATVELRERLRATREYADVALSPLAFVAKAVCLAARRTPEVNAHWDEAAGEIVYYERVQLGIAAATPRGLIVPKIRDADTLSLRELAVSLNALTATARSGRTPPADLVGGTFTITNVGVFGVDTGTPILNPGEAAILAVGAIKPAPWVVNGELAVRTVGQLALSFDHRLVDGEQGSRFLADVGALLTDPGLALTW